MGKVVYISYSEEGKKMVSIFEVARFFLSLESMTHLKLQKLCYYAQAWHLALSGQALVKSEFQAWLHGPVAPELYGRYRDWRNYKILRYDGSIDLPNKEIDFLKAIYILYGRMTGKQLEQLTHNETPWKNARKGIEVDSHCNNPISQKDMSDFYRKLLMEGKQRNIHYGGK